MDNKKISIANMSGAREPNTAYSVGDIAYHGSLPTGWYLKCITEGISSSGNLVINSVAVGGSIVDGTVVWKISMLVDIDISTTYKAKGSIAFVNLPVVITEDMLGWVYNIYDDFITDARFVEGAGNEYFAGENIVIVEVEAHYKLTEDTEAVEGKVYYEDAQGTEVSPQPIVGADISEEGYYEHISTQYMFDVLSGYVDLSSYPRVVSFDSSTGTLTLSTL